VRERLPEVLAYGRLERLRGPHDGRRADIVFGDDQITLSLHRFGRRESWVLTGYELRKGNGPDGTGGGNPRSPYAPPSPRVSGGVGAGPVTNIADGPNALNPGVGQGRIYTASGRSLNVRYEVIDARSLTASHFDDLRENPAYPRELQPRDRSRAASEAQIVQVRGGERAGVQDLEISIDGTA
jgi:hypothetical protein